MISEFEFFHGAALARVLHESRRRITLAPFTTLDNAAYIIDGAAGLYIKYSSKRLSPWRFSFNRRHCEVIARMAAEFGRAVVALVCHDDGIVALSFDEFQQIVGCDQEQAQWISATRNRRQMYLIKGSDGKLEFKIGKDELLPKLVGGTERKLAAGA